MDPITAASKFKIMTLMCAAAALSLSIGAGVIGAFPLQDVFLRNALLGFFGSLITTAKINLLAVYLIQPRNTLGFYINFAIKLILGIGGIGYLFLQSNSDSPSSPKQAFFKTLVENLYAATWGISLGLTFGMLIIYLTIKMNDGGES